MLIRLTRTKGGRHSVSLNIRYQRQISVNGKICHIGGYMAICETEEAAETLHEEITRSMLHEDILEIQDTDRTFYNTATGKAL